MSSQVLFRAVIGSSLAARQAGARLANRPRITTTAVDIPISQAASTGYRVAPIPIISIPWATIERSMPSLSGTMLAIAIHLFIVDLARIEIVYRVIAFLSLAVISIFISVYYTRKVKKSQKEEITE